MSKPTVPLMPEPEPRPSRLGPKGRQARAVARLAAVQALYQMELGGVGVETVVREFADHRFGGGVEGESSEAATPDQTLAEADESFFGELVRGVVADQAEIDRAVVKRLASGWRLERLDATVRAILRAGAWELSRHRDTPTEVVIDEYVELAKAFFGQTEAGFVNAALDAIARDVR
jgi:N utilization substance protein B